MNPAYWLSCGVLQGELQKLLDDCLIAGNLLALDSMLHMRPELLDKVLRDLLNELPATVAKVLVYGDCCAGMVDIEVEFKLARVNAINCAQMLLGREKYRDMMRRESFMFLPEWAERWETVFKQELGLFTPEQAHMVIGDNRKEIIYLDTGLIPVPYEKMQACSQFTGLEWHIEKILLEDNFLPLLLESEQRALELVNNK